MQGDSHEWERIKVAAICMVSLGLLGLLTDALVFW